MEEPAARLLITLLDGTRDRAAIRAELRARTGLELSESDLDNNLVELRSAVPAGALAPPRKTPAGAGLFPREVLGPVPDRK